MSEKRPIIIPEQRDDEIMKKVIEKAIANGWDIWGKLENIDIRLSHMNGDLYKIENKIDAIHFTVPELVFDHSFAKAFWGEENHSYDDEGTCNTCQCYTLSDTLYCWQYYLQQMVLEENSIKYLEKFL